MNTPCFFHFPKNVFLSRRKLGEPHVEMALNFKSSTRWEHTAQWARTWEKVWFLDACFWVVAWFPQKLLSTFFEIFFSLNTLLFSSKSTSLKKDFSLWGIVSKLHFFLCFSALCRAGLLMTHEPMQKSTSSLHNSRWMNEVVVLLLDWH